MLRLKGVRDRRVQSSSANRVTRSSLIEGPVDQSANYLQRLVVIADANSFCDQKEGSLRSWLNEQ